MWYVVQVFTGTEHNICRQAEKVIPTAILQRIFIPHYEQKRRVCGEWKLLQKVLFPGYVFVVTDHIEELWLQLKKVIGLTRLVGAGEDIIPLTEEEVDFLLNFGKEEQIVKMSQGFIENDRVHITDGPLMGMEGCIRKIDRHKRKAWVEVQMFGRKQVVQVGVEIVRKN